MSNKIGKKRSTKFYLGSFHYPGVANIKDESGAYHVNINHVPLYKSRYKNTFGFYCDIATVEDYEGFFHIGSNGKPIHGRRFIWAGNYQEGYCVVRDQRGYYHINKSGDDAYRYRFDYVGDFKNGTAIAYKDGSAFFINERGERVFNKKFIYAQNFHKGFAVVVDDQGWFHIDLLGKALYQDRFAFVEPFYNCIAFGLDFSNRKVQIRDNGTYTYLPYRCDLISIEKLVKTIKAGNRASLIIRHADRHEKKAYNSWGTELLLTERGILRSKRLGEKLQGLRLSIFSSPVERCIQTANYILEGSYMKKFRRHIIKSTLLGAPGSYVKTNRAICKPKEFCEFAYNYIRTGRALNMYDINEGSKRLLRYIYEKSVEPVNLFISHDFLIAAFMHYLGIKEYDKDNLCGYLSGFCILFEQNEEEKYFIFRF